MSIEAFFSILDDGPRRPVAEYVRRLTEAGYPCHEEPDGPEAWVVFEAKESTLRISIEDGAAVFLTFEMSPNDPGDFIDAVFRVFAEAGWSTEEEEI